MVETPGCCGGHGSSGSYRLRELSDLQPGDHLCCLYRTEEDHRSLLAPYMREGLAQGQKIAYIADAHTADTVLGYLHDDGLDVDPYVRSGQLSILSSVDAYMRSEVFDPGEMIGLLDSETRRALDEGFTALRATGEMGWALCGFPGSTRLMEYEARLNDFIQDNRALGICQYDTRHFEPSTLLEVLRTHPIVLAGGEVYENLYYIPPDDYLDDDLSGAILEQWLSNLASRKRIEQTLIRQAEELREVDRRKDAFLATLAHELRNPLSAIRSAAQVLHLSLQNGQSAERALEILDRQIGNASRLLDDMSDVSRISRGKVQLRKEAVGVSAAMSHAAEVAGPLIAASGHELAVSLPRGLLRVEADPTRLEQVLVNLLNNAAKYTESGGRIWFTGAREGDEAVLRVRDTGVGIAAEMLPRIFDLFVQVGTSLERSQGGLGIGLTLVRSLVEMHGGRVEAFSEGPGKGSEFIVRLPVLSDAPQASPGPARRDSAGQGVGLRVLVVDDNADAAEMMAAVLEVEGYQAALAHSGPVALESARASRPDAVLLDIGLPGMDGYEVARQFRQQPDLADVLLIAVTGFGQEQDIQDAAAAGFDHHLIKPVDIPVLCRLLAEARRAPA